VGVTHHGRTERLDLADPTLREWECSVVWSDPADPEVGIVLDRSAFYPGGGGQPPDHGVLLWGGVETHIVGTRKGDDLYLIPAPGDPVPPPGTAVRGAVADERRSLLMRTHSGLHVLTGVVFRDFGALVTGGNMEPGGGRMDFEFERMSGELVGEIEASVNRELAAQRAVGVKILPRDEAFAIPDLIRTKINLLPPGITEVRTVEIVGLDLQADGGTHVANTREVGAIRVTGYESKGRINKRIRIALDQG
jgi:misacylated tRNA(Ala) deacylase